MFALLRSPWDGPWRCFRAPAEIVVAAGVPEVRPALDRVQAALDAGRHAAGFLAYEAAQAFGLPTHTGPPDGLPLLCFGIFEPAQIERLDELPPAGAHELGPWSPDVSRAAYVDAIARIKAHIEAGDTYQINYTFRLRASLSGDPLGVLHDLVRSQRGAWSGYVDTGAHIIASGSPELFFAREGGRFECRPMKGTRPRGRWPLEDRQQAARLQASGKDRAENVMIVDMTRNDLGRLAEIGSVDVRSLFDVERYPRQWQMTSTVVARAPAVRLPAIVEAMFPSGSVTGAPKHRAMEIIRAIEATPRGAYTGAVGALWPDGRAHFNVAIRTVTIARQTGLAEFGVGSGIVWDSQDRDEYDECLLKASVLDPGEPPFRLLETLRWDPPHGFALLDRHLDRMRGSADYFGFRFEIADARNALSRAVRGRQSPARVRLLAEERGHLEVQIQDLAPLSSIVRAALAPEPVDTQDVFLFHKTTRRQVYERARASRPAAEAVVLWNARGEVTEGTEANVVLDAGGRRRTPPVSSGLLPGTLRAELLERGEIVEDVITVDELRQAGRFWLINSVRGWMEAALI